MQKFGVIDLGTNTFHLLIAEQSPNGKWKDCLRKRMYVRLAEQGIEQIADAPFQRGLNALRHFKNLLDQHSVQKVKAFGTAALRTASNASDFIDCIHKETGISVDIIAGEEEAVLIYKGVRQIVSFNKQYGLIMDIGGGSVEFIIANDNSVLWFASFPIGVAVLTKAFHRQDPMPPHAIHQLEQHLDNTLAPLRQALANIEIHQLIGASGTFDVLEAALVKKNNNALTSTFPAESFHPFYEKLIHSNLQERLFMDTIPDSRAEMIVTALILIRYILQLTKAPQITVSAYAMKEGIMDSFFSE